MVVLTRIFKRQGKWIESEFFTAHERDLTYDFLRVLINLDSGLLSLYDNYVCRFSYMDHTRKAQVYGLEVLVSRKHS